MTSSEKPVFHGPSFRAVHKHAQNQRGSNEFLIAPVAPRAFLFVQLLRAPKPDLGRPRRIHTFHSSQRRAGGAGGGGERKSEEMRRQVCVCVVFFFPALLSKERALAQLSDSWAGSLCCFIHATLLLLLLLQPCRLLHVSASMCCTWCCCFFPLRDNSQCSSQPTRLDMTRRARGSQPSPPPSCETGATSTSLA